MEQKTVVEYNKENVITFDSGIIGFEKYREYLLCPIEENSDVLVSLQSVENENLSFFAMNPFYLDKDYDPELEDEDMKELEAEDLRDTAFYVILVVKENMPDSTVNMRCPVAINMNKRKGRQIVQNNEKYGFREKISDFIKKEEDA